MAVVYIVAGPPGVGKSTSGREFIPDGIMLLDADLIIHRYRERGFPDYEYMGNKRFHEMITKQLISGKNFAMELNLGFQDHYDYLRTLKSFDPANRIEVILFHTDDLQLCLDRARERHEQGLHLVPPDIVTEMYHNTIPLLKKNFELISAFTAIDIKRASTKVKSCLKFDRFKATIRVTTSKAQWLDKELITFLWVSMQKQKAEQSLNIHDSKINDSPKKRRGLRI